MSQDIQPSSTNPLAAQWLLYDPTVQDVTVLIAGLNPGVRAVAIPATDNPHEIIATALANPELKSLHLLGHGAPGEIMFGHHRITAQSWSEQFGTRHLEIAANQSPLQINFWSCKTGEGETGMNFLKTIANNTGAFVSASSSLVGHAGQGGTWTLDRHAAPEVPFSSSALDKFESVLEEELNNLMSTSSGVTLQSLLSRINGGDIPKNSEFIVVAATPQEVISFWTGSNQMRLAISKVDQLTVTGDASLSEIEILQALRNQGLSSITSSSNIALIDDVNVLNGFDQGSDIPEFFESILGDVIAVVNQDSDLTQLSLDGVDFIDLNGHQVLVNIDQAYQVTDSSDYPGSYQLVDSVAAIEAEFDGDSVSFSLSGATIVTAEDGVLTLTVAQYKALVDGDTSLSSGYMIDDTATAIADEITTEEGVVSLGVLAGATAVVSDDVVTLSVAEAKALATAGTYAGSYAIVDSVEAIELEASQPGGLLGQESVTSITANGDVDLTVAEYESLGDKFETPLTVTDVASALDGFTAAAGVHVTATADSDDLTGLDLSGVDSIDLDGRTLVSLTLDQARDAQGGTIKVVDSVEVIDAEAAQAGGGILGSTLVEQIAPVRSVGGVFEGTIGQYGERDSYTFTVSSARQVQINLDSTDIAETPEGEIGDPYVYLYDGQGNLIASNDDYDSLDSQLNVTLQPGVYEVRAAGFGDYRTGDYRLTISGADVGSPVELTVAEYEQNGVGAKFVNAADVTVTDVASALDGFTAAAGVHVTATADSDDLTGLDLSGVDSIDLASQQSVKLDVSQAEKSTNGGYEISDSNSALMGEFGLDS